MVKLATMTSVCPDWTVDEIISGIKRLGYKGLEPRTGWGHAAGIEPELSEADRKGIRKRFEDEGLSICCIATGSRFAAADPADLEKSLDEARIAIDLAADLGAGLIRTFGGARGGGEFHGIMKRTADAYRKIVGHAADRGVTVLFETHDEWCVSTQVRAVVEDVDHPNLKVLWDLMHPARFKERPAETMGTIGSLTCHLHAHDGRPEGPDSRMANTPLGDGIIDHATPLQLLNEIGFDGYFSIEVIHKPGSDHDAEGVLKQYAEAFNEMTKGF